MQMNLDLSKQDSFVSNNNKMQMIVSATRNDRLYRTRTYLLRLKFICVQTTNHVANADMHQIAIRST